MRRIVIVGGGLAGHRAAASLRREGFEGDVTMVGDETYRPYDRPPLSKQLLGGEVEQDECIFPANDCDEELTWSLGQRAERLDLEAGVVRLEDGEEVPFDGLLIATGRRAREWPDLPDLEGFHTLRSIDDSLALRAAVEGGCRVAIVGAGFIGCEVAATLKKRGVEDVALIDVAPHPMPVLGEEVGQRAASIHEDRGVTLHLGASITGFVGEGRVEGVSLEDAETVPADLVLIAVGSAPNSEWLEDSGLELTKGAVLCDEHCIAVGTENVAAAGDVAAWPHPDAAGPICIEHWTNARDMGAAAAANLIADPDERKPFDVVPTFWSDQYDVKIKSAGFLGEADSVTVVDEDPERPSLVAEAHRDGELTGAVVFNKNRKIIEYQRKLADKVTA